MAARGAPEGVTAAAGFAFSTTLFWPGVALYDAVEQYRQAVSGTVGDWHPPVMARLWGALARTWPGTAPMLVLQLGLYWLGIGLLSAALARRGRRGPAWLVLLLALGPIVSCWTGTVLKDAQMLGAMTAAVGVGAWYELGEKRRAPWASAALLILLSYATLVRSNAAFATVPLGLVLFGWGGIRPNWVRAAACIGGIAAVLVLAPVLNHRLFNAYREGPENSLLLYDIAGTAIRSGSDAAGVSAARWAALARAGCYSPAAWDALSEPGPCAIAPGLEAEPDTPPLYALWLRTVATHPLAYAAHRTAHFNATLRFWGAGSRQTAVAPVDSEPNRFGLGMEPGSALRTLQEIGSLWVALPIGWPAFWLAVALAGLWASRSTPEGPERALAQALLLSAAVGGLSYAVVSVASDLRYHLWMMLAAGLGLVLLWSGGGVRRRDLALVAAAAILVIVPGAAARLLLPAIP